MGALNKRFFRGDLPEEARNALEGSKSVNGIGSWSGSLGGWIQAEPVRPNGHDMERVRKELARQGYHLDPEHPDQIVCSADGREWTYLEHRDAKKTGSKPERPGLRA